MTMLQRLSDLVLTRAHNQERPPQVAQGQVNFANTGLGVGGQAGMAGQMNTYSTVSSVYAAVSKISEAVASAEWHLYAGPGKSNEVFSHLALTLWNSANEFDTRHDFLEMSQQHFELTGESWWVLVRNNSGIPVEMWAVRPDRMTPIKSHDEYILGYWYTLGGERIPLDLQDVIFIRRPNPLDPYRGQGPIQALVLDLGSEVEAANYNRAFFRNDATPGGIIEADRSMSDPDFKRLVERWKEFHQGTNNAGRIGFLERAKFTERKYTQRDMQFVQLRDQVRDMVLAAYGVPLPMLGVMEAPSRANAQAAEFIFARWAIKPRLNRIRLALNEKLLKLYPDRGLHFEYNDPTPNNRELDLTEATTGYEKGTHKLNEARALLNLEEVPEGDEFKVSVPAPMMGEPFALGVKAGGKYSQEYSKALTEEDIAERAMLLGWKRRLAAEAAELVAFLEQFGKPTLELSVVSTKIEISDIQGYDWDWWSKYGPEVIEELEASIRIAMLNQFPAMSLVTAQELAATYARERGARLLRADGNLNLTNATRNRVNVLVARTIENGESLSTLQKSLREDLAFSPEKARVVARTETATAQGQGAKQAAEAQDFDQKRWITQGDDVVDATGAGTPCLDAEGEGWIKVGDPFINGLDTIPAHPNCRCNVRYRRDPDRTETRSVCSHCGKPDMVVTNRDGAGYFCRRCNLILIA